MAAYYHPAAPAPAPIPSLETVLIIRLQSRLGGGSGVPSGCGVDRGKVKTCPSKSVR